MGSTTCNTTSSGLGLTVLSAAQVNGLLTVTNGTTSSTIAISIPNATGPYHFTAFLSDSATVGVESVYVPDVSGDTSWDDVTDSSGEKTITIQNNGAARTWYFWVRFQRMNITGAVTVGV